MQTSIIVAFFAKIHSFDQNIVEKFLVLSQSNKLSFFVTCRIYTTSNIVFSRK